MLSQGVMLDLGVLKDCSGCRAENGLSGGVEPLMRGVRVEDEGGLGEGGGRGERERDSL